jgi:GlpG protein
VRRGEWWRLVTSILPHGDPLHLLFNLYWLWVFGAIVEEKFGHLKTALLVLLFAVGASALEFAFLEGGIGLSGVGYGFFGMLWMLSRHDPRFHDAIDERTIKLFLIWFVFCIATTVTKVYSVANLAHAGGLLLGVLVGVIFSMPSRKFFAAGGFAAVLLFSMWAATMGRPRVNVSGKAGYTEGRWGYEALMANRNDEAIQWLQDAVAYQPNNATFWYDLGIAYGRAQKSSAARSAYAQAHQLEPGNADYTNAAKTLN